MSNERAMWLGAAISVAATLLLTTIAATLESSINGPGTRVIAPPVLWAFGGGAGLLLGAVVEKVSGRPWGTFRVRVSSQPERSYVNNAGQVVKLP